MFYWTQFDYALFFYLWQSFCRIIVIRYAGFSFWASPLPLVPALPPQRTAVALLLFASTFIGFLSFVLFGILPSSARSDVAGIFAAIFTVLMFASPLAALVGNTRQTKAQLSVRMSGLMSINLDMS